MRKEVLPVCKQVLPVRKEVPPMRKEVLPVCNPFIRIKLQWGGGLVGWVFSRVGGSKALCCFSVYTAQKSKFLKLIF